MSADELLNKLRYKSEGTDIDFKSAQYRFIGRGEDRRPPVLSSTAIWSLIPNEKEIGREEAVSGCVQDRTTAPGPAMGDWRAAAWENSYAVSGREQTGRTIYA